MTGLEVCERFNVGERQAAMLMRSHHSLVMAKNDVERYAANRLVRRGILRPQRFGSPAMGYITVYVIQS